MARIVESDSCLEILTHDGKWWVREILHDQNLPSLRQVEGGNLHDARALAASVRIAHDRTYHGPRAKGR